MQITINGSTIDLVPVHLLNDVSKSGYARVYFGFTDWAEMGATLDLRFIYSDIQRQYGGSDYTGDWEDMFEWYQESGGASPGNVHKAQCRALMSASDPLTVTWQFRQYETDPSSTWHSIPVYFGNLETPMPDHHVGETQVAIIVVENINAEQCVNSNDVPTYQPGDDYNGIDVVYLSQCLYNQAHWENVNDEWTGYQFPNVYLYDTDDSIPPNAHNTPAANQPRAFHLLNGSLATWELEHGNMPGFGGLQFNGAPVEDIDPTKKPDDDNTPPGGGNGPYRDTSSRIGPAALPRTSALSAGFVKAYMPSATQIQSLSSYMLTDNFIEGVKKLMANPIDYIMGLHMIPVTPTTASSTIKVGGLDTEIPAPLVTNEYVQYDCGTLAINEFWGSFIDYAPSTKAELYLPFIGTVPLDIDDIMGTPCTLHLYYNINVLSGACTAFLDCQTGRKLNSVCYYWNGSMSSQIPVTGNDYSNKVNAALSAVGNLIGVAATGSVGNAVGLVQNVAQATLQKPSIQKSGTMGGDAGMLSEFQPFVILTRPVQALPKNFNKLRGNTSMIGGKVSSFRGYLEVSEIDLSGIACTEAEKDLILQAFKEGCFV